MRKTGGPAFPQTLVQHVNGEVAPPAAFCNDASGMELRDYLAAHAPKNPHAWFAPVMPTPKPEPVYACSGTGEHKYRNEFDDHQWCTATNARERQAWEMEWSKQRSLQWPYAWADAQLVERDRERPAFTESCREVEARR